MLYFECRMDQSEIFLVEGKNAANAVNRVRNKSNQAVLAMQGKVPNIAKTNLPQQIEKNEHVRRVISILKSWAHPTEATAHRYNHVVILSDPDADGIHAAMLLASLLAEAFPDLVREQCLLLCRCPLFQLLSDGDGEELAYSDEELNRRGLHNEQRFDRAHRFKGIASLPAELLYRTCIDPNSRNVSVLSEAYCAAVKQRLS